MNNELWIVAQWKGEDKSPEFHGVFDSETGAIEACKTDDFYIFPAILNQEISIESMGPHPCGYYPRLQDPPIGL